VPEHKVSEVALSHLLNWLELGLIHMIKTD